MPWLALLRTSPAAWGLIPACVWMWLLTHQPSFDVTEGYWEAATAQIAMIGVIPAALCAASGAWEAARLRRSRLVEGAGGAPARSPIAVALSQLTAVWCVGLLCVLWAVLCVIERAAGSPGGPDLWVVALLTLMLCTYTLLGYAIGWLFPGVLAVPAAAVATFLWLSYPAALEPVWLRQLNGTNLKECCALDRTLAPSALGAPALLSAGLLVAALTVISGHGLKRRLLAVLPVAAALAVAVPLAVPMGFEPSQQRDPSARRCTDSGPEVCLWPEQQKDAARVTTWVRESATRLTRVGISPPKKYAPIFSHPSRSDVITTLVGGIMPEAVPACAQRGPWPGGEAYLPIGAWLELTAGAVPADVAARLDGEGKTMSLLGQVRALPPKNQITWYRTNYGSLTNCTKQPRLDPDLYRGGTP